MEKYEGVLCPVCRGKLFEDDDIVVCPECGAPHHRECYNSLGECAYADKHGTEEQFVMPETPATEDDEKKDDAVLELDGAAPVKMSFEGVENPFFERNNIDKDEKLDGITIKEIAQFVGYNALRYILVFRRMVKTKSVAAWNWLAFLLPTYWLMARKCYRAGAIFLSYQVLWTSLFSATLGAYMEKFGLPSGDAAVSAAAIASKEYIALLVLSAIELAVRVTAGLLGDYLYKRKVYGTINRLRADGVTDETVYMACGGINILMPVLAAGILFFAASILEMLI